MTRDNADRLEVFLSRTARSMQVEVRRLALNMPQIEEYGPPPNPAKVTDSRFQRYSETYGDESWELDALEPAVLVQLVRDEVDTLRDDDAWNERVAQLHADEARLDAIIEALDDEDTDQA